MMHTHLYLQVTRERIVHLKKFFKLHTPFGQKCIAKHLGNGLGFLFCKWEILLRGKTLSGTHCIYEANGEMCMSILAIHVLSVSQAV